MSRPLRVFLCHASQDKTTVRKLYRRLKAENWIEPWLDEQSLLPGQDFDLEIYKATRDADAIIICLSRNSVVKEGYVNKEIRRALDIAQEKPEGAIYVIPLRLDDCDPSFEQLKKLHWVDYFALNGHERLLKSLRARADSLQAPVTEGQVKRFFALSALPNLNYLWFGLSGLLILALMLGIFRDDFFSGLFLAQATATITITPTPVPTKTTTPTKTSTPVPPTSTFTPTPGIGSTMIGEDGMILVYVPEGEFTMGSEDRELDEKPEHQVYLDAFWIDQTEVTNAMYAQCVADDICEPPLKTTSNTRERYYGNRDFNDYPVNYVTWSMAKTYCGWAGRDLPTEAQWEKAARGTDGREFPWGTTQISAALLNYAGSNLRDTTKVGAYPQGQSPYGALDMAGNSFEWVNDWYSSTYYQESPPANPTGPISGQARVVRGGAWGYGEPYARTAYRNLFRPDGVYNFGFRCVLSQ